MDDTTIEQQSFIRQRRNLILASLVLWFAQKYHITITQINVLGNILELDEVIVVKHYLWVMWGYFVLRYYQYSWALLIKDFRRQFLYKRGLYVEDILKSKLNKDNSLLRELFPGQIENISSYEFINSPATHGETFTTTNVSVEVLVKHDEGEAKNWLQGVPLKFKDLYLSNIKSLYYVTICTAVVTEYIVPFVIAAIPVGYWVYGERCVSLSGQILCHLG